MPHTIADFWSHQLTGIVPQRSASSVPGWSFVLARQPGYVEADLTLRDGFDDLTQRVWLIGAPGAVGKSTLAKELAAHTGAIYLDLAQAATVAGNYMVGGLVYANVLNEWTLGKAAVVIDALDEARLRVTQSGFEDFLIDVAKAASLGKFPIVIFGRVGIIEEAWTILAERAEVSAPIFDIQLFGEQQANRFVFARLNTLAAEKDIHERATYHELARALEDHGAIYEEVVTRVVKGLKELSTQDGNNFVGYAPVLDAVAKVIAAEGNPARIGEEMQRVLEGEVLTRLALQILNREQGKLVSQLKGSDTNFPAAVYSPEEQLERLSARLFGAKPPPLPAQLTQQQVASYEEAVNNLLPQHPFLDGAGAAPSSAVFAGCIIASALKGQRDELRKAAEKFASSGQHTPNPFLNEFYGAATEVPTEHIGLIFESVLARTKPGESARLSIEGDAEAPALSVEIVVERPEGEPGRLEFTAPASGAIRLGRRVMGVTIDAEGTGVELGTGDQLELVAPVFVAAKSLALFCNQIVAKVEPNAMENTIILEAEELLADPGLMAPTVRTGVELQVSWPESSSYPWTAFSAPATGTENPKTAEALRALRRLVIAFRSHSKGQLARYKGKIDHQRMMKGEVGKKLLAKLMADEVITLGGPMYYLHPDALGEKVGASFVNVKLKNYADRTRAYVQSVL